MKTGISLPVVLLGLWLAGPARAEVVSEDHFVDVGQGVTLHVVEKRPDPAPPMPRAVLFLTATLVPNAQWDSDVFGDPTYNGLLRAARRGYHAFSASYEGYGLSTKPENGKVVTAERILAQMEALIEWIGARTGAPTVDLFGSSLGSNLAGELGGANSAVGDRIGRIVLTSLVYKQPGPLLEHVLLSDVGCAGFDTPDGYLETSAPIYATLLHTATLKAQAWAYTTFPGRYAAGPTLEGCDLPVFEASGGRAPALVFWGYRDLFGSLEDATLYCEEYGGTDCRVAIVPRMGHAPNFEHVRGRFWREAFAFLEEEPS